MSREELQELEKALEAAGEAPSVERVDALNALAWELGFWDVDRSTQFAEEAVRLSEKIGYRRGLGWGQLNRAYRDYYLARYERAFETIQKALEIFEEVDEPGGIANGRMGFGLLYWSLGEFEGAIENLRASIRIFEDLNEETRQAWAWTTLGGVLTDVGDLERAIDGHERALELFRKHGESQGEGRALTGLATVYRKQGRLDSALEYALRSLELTRGHHEVSQSRALNDVGTIYFAKGDIDKAEDYLTQALEMRRRIGNFPAEITSLLDLGSLYLQKGELGPAFEHLERALKLATDAKTKPKLYKAHELLARAHEASGNFERALAHQRAFQEVKEQVAGEESANRLKNLEIKLQAESVEQLKEAYARLVQQEKMASLGKLVAGVAHEINTPVGVIQSAVDVTDRALSTLRTELERAESLEALRASERFQRAVETLRDNRDAAAGAGRRLSTIVASLKTFTQLDGASFQLADVNEAIESTLALLEPQWGERVRVVRELGNIPKIESYPTELNQALMTILINAGEAIESSGTVTVSTRGENGHVRITTSDTGRGIPRDRLDSLFDIGFAKKGSNIRLNVGLANVSATVSKHRGEITVESEIDKGTTFRILLPVRQSPRVSGR